MLFRVFKLHRIAKIKTISPIIKFNYLEEKDKLDPRIFQYQKQL